MEPRRFDAFARSLTASRRGTLGVLIASALTSLMPASFGAAKKKKKHKKKKKCKVACGTKVCGPSNCKGKSCGSCPAGEACNAKGQCACVPEPPETTCASVACGPATNNCGEEVMCQCAQSPCRDAACQQGNCVVTFKQIGDPCNGEDELCCGNPLSLTCVAVDNDPLNCGACGTACGARADRCAGGECRCGNHPLCPVNAECQLGTCLCTDPGEVYFGEQCIQAACCANDQPGVLCGGECVADVCCGLGKGCESSAECCDHGLDSGQTDCFQSACCLQNLSPCTAASAHLRCSGHCFANFCQ